VARGSTFVAVCRTYWPSESIHSLGTLREGCLCNWAQGLRGNPFCYQTWFVLPLPNASSLPFPVSQRSKPGRISPIRGKKRSPGYMCLDNRRVGDAASNHYSPGLRMNDHTPDKPISVHRDYWGELLLLPMEAADQTRDGCSSPPG